MAETCIVKAVTLTNGEQFVLPPGAVLIGASDSGAITSSCGPLPTLEETACYGFVCVATEGVDGGETEVFEQTQITYYGISISGVNYTFDDSVLFSDGALALQDQLDQLNLGFTDFCVGSSDDPGRNSYKFYVMFKTIPSMADNMLLISTTRSPNAASGIADVEHRIPAITPAAMLANGNEDFCSCEVL